jgi:putative ABC transport system permease protein
MADALRAAMRSLWPDIRYALRVARRAPGLSAVAVICLALGIGANTAVFSVFNALLLRPLPYRDADRLIAVFETNPARGWSRALVCPADFLDWREQSQSFESFAAFRGWTPNLTGVTQAERLVGLRASGSLFQLLGVGALAGRGLLPDDEQQRARVVVVSHGLWLRVFGGDPRLVGRSVRLDGESYEVVGIMPRDFQFPNRVAEVWTPLNLESERQQRGEHDLQVIARLKSGVDEDRARAELVALMQRIDTDNKNSGCSASAISMRDWYIGNTRQTLWILLGAVAIVLLIACANVANLLLAHGSTREQEFALRVTLGASPGRLIRQRLTESVLLALAGAALGIALSVWGRDAFLNVLPEASVYRLVPAGVDWRVLAYTIGLSLLTAVIFGIIPALRASRVGLRASATDARVTPRVQTALLVAQTALAVTLLVGSGLLVNSFMRIWKVDPGFSAGEVLTARMNLPGRYAEPEQPAFFETVLERLRATPDVKAAGVVTNLPLGGGGNNGYVTFEDRPAPPPDAIDRPIAERLLVSAGFFEALQIPLHEGRLFTAADTVSASPVVIINRAFALRYWPNESPLGRRIKRGTPQAPFPWMTIVGVVRDIKQNGLLTNPGPTIYIPHSQSPSPGMTIVVRADAEAAVMAARLRSIVRDIDPDQPVAAVRTLEDVVFGSLAARWLPMLWLTVFASLSLVLASLGVYGVVSYAVARRAREFGIRLALGAEGRDLVRLALKQGMWPVAIGAVIGTVVAANLTRFIGYLLYDIEPTKVLTHAAAVGMFLLAGLLASYPPARRVARQDPTVALRQE